MLDKVIVRQTSRISNAGLIGLFSLGDIYMSDFLNDPSSKVAVPLTLTLDMESGLLQLKHTAPLDNMYRNYWYRSGMNQTMTDELKGLAYKAMSLVRCEQDDVVLDIGCNDGTLLKFYGDKLYKVGFDPANNMAQYSKKYADKVVVDYFTAKAYFKTVKKNAKIITAIAMFYDLEDPHSFVDDIDAVLDTEGLWIVQMSYMPLMLQQHALDNLCHEHLEYYSLSSLEYLISQHDMKIVDVELNDINGGSFRVYIRKNNSNDDMFASAPYRDVAQFRINSLMEYEKCLKLKTPSTYIKWYEELLALREQAVSFIKQEKDKGKTIYGYGASTKGNTLLQWYGLDNTMIDAIAERNPQKYGLRTVGTDIEIISEDEMRQAKPDYLLVLPWHFITEFKNREQEYLDSGGKFIVPLPQFEIIGKG